MNKDHGYFPNAVAQAIGRIFPLTANLVACSRAHAALCGPRTRFVYYGLDLKEWQYSYTKRPHLVHLAKIARIKGQHLAIWAARLAGKSLALGGVIAEPWYYHGLIKPMLWLSPKMCYLGEIQDQNRFLQEAAALLQTPQRFDPFPVSTLEAFACGTPVIALIQGGLAEQVVNGVNGFLCHTWQEMVAAIGRLDEIKPQRCRDYAETYFSVQRMTHEYEELYLRVCDGEHW